MISNRRISQRELKNAYILPALAYELHAHQPAPLIETGREIDDRKAGKRSADHHFLQVRGPNVFIGSWKMPEKTAEDFTADGLFDTGDQGRIDDDYLSIVGRSEDMAITGGLNVYPRKVERFIDDLAGVKASAVIGVTHPDSGEGVVAVVATVDGATLGEDDVILAARNDLANYKVPRRVVFVDDLPRNAMAKVQKGRLRECYGNLFASATARATAFGLDTP